MKKLGALLAIAMVALPCAAPAQTDAAPGWITASNQPCKIWNPAPQPDESVTWSGGCQDGLRPAKASCNGRKTANRM